MLRLVGILGIAVIAMTAGVAWQLRDSSATSTAPVSTASGHELLRIGHVNTPVLSALFLAASDHADYKLRPFATTGDVGYALLSKELDVGFVEPTKLDGLLELANAEPLRVVGVVDFPYGSTLVVHKSLDIRLGDVAGKSLAARSTRCRTLHQFKVDAQRLEVDLGSTKFKFMEFDTMLPALESRTVDGALMKGSDSVLAQLQGHKVLYQNWNVEAGDACCPAVLAQANFFLVTRGLNDQQIEQLVSALEVAERRSPNDHRAAAARVANFPVEAFEKFPTARFARLNAELRKEVGGAAWPK